MVFLISTITSLLATVIYGVLFGAAKRESKNYLQKCSITGIILIPVVGLGEGTFYSHGFDIHWFVFGLANFLVILLTALMVVGGVKIYEKIGKT